MACYGRMTDKRGGAYVDLGFIPLQKIDNVDMFMQTGGFSMADSVCFPTTFFSFLRDLKKNNNRDWFGINKARYENDVKKPAMDFICAFAPALARLSKHFIADPQKSMFRIYRDTRFSKDKSPYKTHVGIQFRHISGKDAHAPGFYLHLEPQHVFVGIGSWRPDSTALAKIRDAIVAAPAAWKRASQGKKFSSFFELGGESLKRPPKGYDPEHKWVEDLKRKDFIASAALTTNIVSQPGFVKEFETYCRAGAPFVRLLCHALDVGY